jgi:TPR repeat protein
LGNPCGQYNWARFLELGLTVPRDLKEAEYLYELAAQGGLEAATESLNRMKGTIPPGSMLAQIERGVRCYESGQFLQASDLFRHASQRGSALAAFNLACLAERGLSPGDDFLTLYRQAAAAGHPSAQNNLALLLVADKPDEAVELMKKAAERSPFGKFNFALAIERQLTNEEPAVAAEMFGLAKDEKIPEAMANYAERLISGNGVETNVVQAKNYFEMAYQTSQRRLIAAEIGARHVPFC